LLDQLHQRLDQSAEREELFLIHWQID
jgi:hypothetical protein